MLHLLRTVLLTAEVPETWKQTMFNMLPKTKGAKSTSDFRPIAVVRLSYTTFAYLVLGRIKATLDAGHPKKNSMDSKPMDASKNTCLPLSSCFTKILTFDVAMWIVSLICRRQLTRSDGKTCGKPSVNMDCPITCSRVCNLLIMAKHGGLKPTALMEICFVSGQACKNFLMCVLNPRLFTK